MVPYSRGGLGNAAAASATVGTVISRHGWAARSCSGKLASRASRNRVFIGRYFLCSEGVCLAKVLRAEGRSIPDLFRGGGNRDLLPGPLLGQRVVHQQQRHEDLREGFQG